jgi:tetratricopeptide (TPR) repeat protein
MTRLRTWHLCAALLLLTLGAYLPLWRNGFVDFDDERYIAANHHVGQGLTWPGFRWAWTTFEGVYWQPLTWLSLQLDARLFGASSPAAFHGENLLWHAAGALLLFGLWQRLTGARWRSFLLAALFAVHPLHVESVAWAAERKDVLSVFFGIVTLWAYVYYLDRPGWGRYLLVAGAFALSLLAKPTLITLPFVLLLLDWWPLGRRAAGLAPAVRTAGASPAARPAVRELLLEKVPLLALAAAVAFVTMLSQGQSGKEIPYNLLPLPDRLANAASAYGWYLVHTFVPVNLAVLYQHPGPNWSVPWVLGGSAALLLITLAAWRQASRRPWFPVGWLWFVGTLLPVIGFVQVGEQAWADRFTYWPHIGIFLVVAWGLGELAERFRAPAPAAAAAGAAALAALAVVTWMQVGYWHDSTALWERALAVTENNHRAHQQLGQAALAQGRPGEAADHFAEAVRMRPELGGVWRQLAMIRMQQGRPAEAAVGFRKVLELQGGAPADVYGLGEALWQSGDRDGAARVFQTALRVNPADPLAWHELGAVYLSLGNQEAAADAFRRALHFQPQMAQTRSMLGLALGRSGQWADAVNEQRQAVQAQEQADQYWERRGRPFPPGALPPVVVFRCRLAYALDHTGARSEAAEVYRAALQRYPEWPARFAEEARKLATDPDVNRRDPRLALEMISQAIAATGEPSAEQREVLAAAQAALGQSR